MLTLQLFCLVCALGCPGLQPSPASRVPGSSIAWCFCGCLSPSSRPPASPSLRVPLFLQAHPTLLPQQKQPLVFPLCSAPSSQPLTQSAPGSLLCVRLLSLFQAPLCSPSHVACDAGRLGRLDLLCKFVVPLPCCCPGPSLAPPSTVYVLSLCLPLCWPGDTQHSSGFDRNVGHSC